MSSFFNNIAKSIQQARQNNSLAPQVSPQPTRFQPMVGRVPQVGGMPPQGMPPQGGQMPQMGAMAQQAYQGMMQGQQGMGLGTQQMPQQNPYMGQMSLSSPGSYKPMQSPQGQPAPPAQNPAMMQGIGNFLKQGIGSVGPQMGATLPAPTATAAAPAAGAQASSAAPTTPTPTSGAPAKPAGLF